MAEQRPRPPVVACTIVARNYLPAARVLARSYLTHHPDHEFVVAVIDGAGDASADGYRIVGPSSFGIDTETYLRMATAYSVTELATAVKPYLLRELRRTHPIAVYLDPDIQVFAPMPEVAELANKHSIVLTPHFTSPLPRDGKEPDDAVIMGTGIFNLGFVGVGPGSEGFLDFWADRLRHDAIVAPERQLFTDQRWVDQVPALFRHTVLTDPGFNVAYWNLHEREVVRDSDGNVTAGGRPLRFFHFSGYRPERPWLLTYHCARKPRVLLSQRPALRRLCDVYGAALKAAGYAETLDAVPYGYATFGDGTPLPPGCRRVFRDGWIAAELKGEPLPPHAFGEDGGAALREWLASPADHGQAAAGLNRLALAVWESRIDLQLAFPHPTGGDSAGFRSWCESSGPVEGALPRWAMPVAVPTPQEPDEDFGVNLLGYLTAELGLGEMGRIVHDAIRHAGVDVASVLEERAVSNRTALEKPATTGEPRYGVSVLAVNADQTRVAMANHPQVMHNRYRIGLWAWELEDFPSWQHEAFQMVDEVWTVSDFCRAAFQAHTDIPVKTIPVPVRDPGEPRRKPRREGDPVTFLFAFDFNSVAQRKNPWATVEAFRRAFGDRDDVRLVVKTINAELHPHDAERLRLAVAGDRRIRLIERYLSVEELAQLYDNSDCYVSLHRSEGFGLTVAEAMARGLPVISTAYSGTTEFLDERTGWPVPCRMVRVGEGCYPYHADALWADPDLDAAAAAMREVADDPQAASARGAAARQHILKTRSVDAAAEWLSTELRRAHETWLARREAQRRQQPPEHPLVPMHLAKEALRWQPDPGSASRTPLAPAVRKAVLRAIDHYDVHQRKVIATLFEGAEDTMSRLLRRIESLESALDHGREEAAATAKRYTVTREQLDQLAERAPRQQLELRELRQRVDDLTEDVAARQHTIHEMFRARDRRLDNDEHAIQRLTRDVGALHEAARLRHAPVPAGADVVVCDAGMLLLPVDEVMLPWIRHHRSWEESEAALLARLAARRPGAFLDIGAHVGYHTLRLLRSCPDVTQVVAVEADPVNAGYLRRNVAANLPSHQAALVTVLEAAAWDTDGSLVLVHAGGANSGDHRVRAQDGSGGPLVPAVRLDGNVEVMRQPVSLVKVDLQGRDHRALAGLQETLERDRPDVLCEFCPEAIVELGDDPAQVLLSYRKFGYRPSVVLAEGGVVEDEPDEALIRRARDDERSFVTLWLRPS
ncbi:methyltransferase, FkbM family [Saccharomonospora marina XMU15]|uniref:Methyltransferase, FkbM family n=1 Tax=Saccharomonospora marina XMU15 TaxID=882083 RepID=H5X0C0_9PSEU|nr:FkbM family methyltransferase [Saccharomonospora marina]EHR48580.1 methyltransferase, FkbM family [Saccharomonospora marina XMU15]